MAAPTNVRIWAIAQSSVLIKWTTAGGSAGVEVLQSTDNVIFTSVAVVPVATISYTVTGLAPEVKYYFKLTNDNSVSFSSTVTVKTHACGDGSKTKGFHLPRVNPLVKVIPIGRLGKGGLDNSDLNEKEIPIYHMKINKAMQDVEDVIKKNVFHQSPCEVCVTDGAIVIDCSDGCDCYNVEAATDINSISFVNCDEIDPCIHFKVPPGTTVGICGWPQGHNGFGTQFGGDECFEAPITGGTTGKTVTTGTTPPKSKPGSGSSGGGNGGGGIVGGCECVPDKTGGLTVKCCTKNCSMNCSSTKNQEIKICGGKGPYSISGSAGLTFKNRGGTTVSSGIGAGQTVVIAPPTNAGSAVVGTAYYRCFRGQTAAEPCSCENCRCDVSCNDVNSGCVALSSECTTPQPVIYLVTTPFPKCTPGSSGGIAECKPADPAPALGTCGAAHATGTSGGTITDKRTAGMITDGCNPCGVASSGKTFTVTDAQGVSVVSTITV